MLKPVYRWDENENNNKKLAPDLSALFEQSGRLSEYCLNNSNFKFPNWMTVYEFAVSGGQNINKLTQNAESLTRWRQLWRWLLTFTDETWDLLLVAVDWPFLSKLKFESQSTAVSCPVSLPIQFKTAIYSLTCTKEVWNLALIQYIYSLIWCKRFTFLPSGPLYNFVFCKAP